LVLSNKPSSSFDAKLIALAFSGPNTPNSEPMKGGASHRLHQSSPSSALDQPFVLPRCAGLICVQRPRSHLLSPHIAVRNIQRRRQCSSLPSCALSPNSTLLLSSYWASIAACAPAFHFGAVALDGVLSVLVDIGCWELLLPGEASAVAPVAG